MALPGVKVNRATRQRVSVLGAPYPNIDGIPIPNFDLNGTGPEEWLIIWEPVDPSGIQYDSRYYQLLRTETAIALDEHPDYPGVGAYRITYTTPKLPIADILNNLENAENDANNQAWPIQKQFKIMAIALRAAYKSAIGLNLTGVEQSAFDLMQTYTAKLIDNYANAQAKKTLIEGNQEPDMDSGWTTNGS